MRRAGRGQALKTETRIAQQRGAMPFEACLRCAAVEVDLRDVRMLHKERGEIVGGNGGRASATDKRQALQLRVD